MNYDDEIEMKVLMMITGSHTVMEMMQIKSVHDAAGDESFN